MSKFAARDLPPKLPALLVAGLLSLASQPPIAADDTEATEGRRRSPCSKPQEPVFPNTVEVSGSHPFRAMRPQVRPERMWVEGRRCEWWTPAIPSPPGRRWRHGRLGPDAGQCGVQAPAAVLVSVFIDGDRRDGVGQGRGAILYYCALANPTWSARRRRADIAKLAVNQTAADQGDRRRRRRRAGCGPAVEPTVEPNSQLGQVFVGITTNRRLLVYSVRAGEDQDRAELRLYPGAAHRHPLRHRRHRGSGDTARPRRDAAGGNRIDVGRPGRDPQGHRGRRDRRRARRRAAARGRSGAAGDGGRADVK